MPSWLKKVLGIVGIAGAAAIGAASGGLVPALLAGGAALTSALAALYHDVPGTTSVAKVAP